MNNEDGKKLNKAGDTRGRPRKKVVQDIPGRTLGEVRLFTCEEVAAATKSTPLTIRQYCREGILQARKVGRRWLIPENAVRQYFGIGPGKD